MRAEVDVRPVRERRRASFWRALHRTVSWRRVGVWSAGVLAFLVVATGVFFAGSVHRIPAGAEISGVKVAGLDPEQAAERLRARFARMARVPVVFTSGGEEFALRPRSLDARVDWRGAAEEARARGEWPLPFRGLKRVAIRLFGTEVQPTAEVYEPRLDFEVERMANALDRPGRNASIVLRGLTPSIVRHEEGRTLDRRATEDLVVRAFARFEREPLALPVRIGPPAVTAADLEPVLEQVRTALADPVRFGWKDAHWMVHPTELATLIRLPADGRRGLEIGGPAAERYFGLLSRAVDRKPRSAQFAIRGERVSVVPSASGRKLDVAASGKALLAAALSPTDRNAELVVSSVDPELTTEKARRMKVTSVLASYTTAYSGSYDRIRNLRLAAGLLDGTTLAPGATFSFNEVVGPRTQKRGFRKAPAIMDGVYEAQFGGGVSQVATTIFNAAWEAGLELTQRTAHSLYIDRYPLGRDATVNFPNVDLKFTNDTDNWVVVRGQATDVGITISLLGAPTNRGVVSETGELRGTGAPEVERIPDPTLYVGEQVVVDDGEPAREVSVRRVVYQGDEELYRETWYTRYISEPKIVRVGTIPVEDEPPPAPPPTAPPSPPAPNPTTSTTTTTTPTTTGSRP